MAKNKIFDGLSDFGKSYVTLGSVFGLLVCILAFIGGVYYFFKKGEDDFERENNKAVGSILIGFSLVVMVMISINLYFTRKFKSYTAAEGVLGGIDIAKGLFNGNTSIRWN